MKHTIGATEARSTRGAAALDASRGLSKNDSERVFENLEDHIEAFCHLAVVEFLNKKGFRRTANMYNTESRSVSASQPSDKAWYAVSSALDLPALMRGAEKRGSKHETVLEILVDHIKGRRHARAKARGGLGTTAAVTAPDDELDGALLSTDPLNDFDGLADAPSPGDAHSAPRSYSPSSDGSVDASPPRGAGGGDHGSPGGGRFGASAKTKKRGRQGMRRSGAGPKSAAQFGTVDSLQRRLQKAHISKSASTGGLGGATAGGGKRLPSVGGATGKGKSKGAKRDKSGLGRSPLRRPPSPTAVFKMPTKMDPTGSAPVSKVRWMPVQARLKMLKRDMDLIRINAANAAQYESDKKKREATTSPLELEKQRDKYSGKQKKGCALCEHTFAQMNLPLAITLKAIVDVRMSWGLKAPHPRTLRPPHCYDLVRVCVFCAQFFDQDGSYRLDPAATQAALEDAERSRASGKADH